MAPDASASADIDGLLAAMRPKLHRYCARMVGSVIDGEDVLQDALIKAVEAFASAGSLRNPEGWLFRIVHNTALDFLRRRNRQQARESGEEVDMIADPADTIANREFASASLRTFMRLPLAQRSSVILTDVLGCSLKEVCDVMDYSLPAVKAALHRGRAQLRELADEPDDLPHPKLSEYPDISEITRRSATGIWCRGRWKAALRSWCSIPPSRARGRNLSCCCSGLPTRSRPSAIFGMRPTSSMGPSI